MSNIDRHLTPYTKNRGFRVHFFIFMFFKSIKKFIVVILIKFNPCSLHYKLNTSYFFIFNIYIYLCSVHFTNTTIFKILSTILYF